MTKRFADSDPKVLNNRGESHHGRKDSVTQEVMHALANRPQTNRLKDTTR